MRPDQIVTGGTYANAKGAERTVVELDPNVRVSSWQMDQDVVAYQRGGTGSRWICTRKAFAAWAKRRVS